VIWAAPGSFKTIQKGGGRSPLPCWMVLNPPESAQTPETTNFQPNPTPPSAEPSSDNRRVPRALSLSRLVRVAGPRPVASCGTQRPWLVGGVPLRLLSRDGCSACRKGSEASTGIIIVAVLIMLSIATLMMCRQNLAEARSTTTIVVIGGLTILTIQTLGVMSDMNHISISYIHIIYPYHVIRVWPPAGREPKVERLETKSSRRRASTG